MSNKVRGFSALIVALSILSFQSQVTFASKAHRKHQNNNSELKFTKENIEANPDKVHYFVELAKQNIIVPDWDTLAALHTLLNKYPKTAVSLTPVIFNAFDKVDATLIMNCIEILLIHQATLDQKKIFINQYESHIISSEKQLTWLAYKICHPGYQEAAQWIKEIIIKNVHILSIATIDNITTYIKDTRFHAALVSRFGIISQENITNAILMRWIKHSLYYVPEDLQLTKPQVLYREFLKNLSDNQKICLVLDRLPQFSINDLELIYTQFITNSQDRIKLKEAAQKLNGTTKIDMPTLLLEGIPEKLEKPKFLYENAKLNFADTQSEHHFYANLAHIVTLFRYEPKRNSTPQVKKMLWQAFLKEIEEKQKGRYVFWHGRNWRWHFRADLYKSLHNLTASFDNKMNDNFIPLRFGDNPDTRYNGSLFLNYALFGNASNHGSGTVAFVLGNYDVTSRSISGYTSEWFFAKFGLDRYYVKYKDKLTQLEELHTKANNGNYGNLLLISVAEKDLHRIQPAREYPGLIDIEVGTENTHDMKKIIDALMHDPMTIQKGQSDVIEFTMKLDNDYALNPKKDLHIYSFDACDETIMEHYVKLREEIFANIAQDMKAEHGIQVH